MPDKIKFFKFWSDWTDINEIEVDLNNYTAFKFQFRFGKGIFLFGKIKDEWIDINESVNQHQLAYPKEVYKLILSKDKPITIEGYYGGETFKEILNNYFRG